MPIITLVFVTAAFIALSLVKQQMRSDLEYRLKDGLETIHMNVLFQKNLLEGLAQQVLNSRELIDQKTNNTLFLHDLAIKDILHNHFIKAKKLLPNMRSIQFIDVSGKVLATADNRSPFDPIILEQVPEALQPWNNSNTADKIRPVYFMHKTSNETVTLGLIQPFTKELFTDLSASRWDLANTSYALISVNLVLQEDIHKRLLSALGEGYQLIITPAQSLPNQELDTLYSINTLNLGATLDTALYSASLSPATTRFSIIMEPYYQLIGLLTLCTILLTYYLLKHAIHKHMIKPVLQLANNIRDISRNENSQLHVMDNKDEISELNNAYLNLTSKDSLTGLFNRDYFRHTLTQSLNSALKQHQSVALFYIDLDNFKRVNDQYGHSMGDALLAEFSQRLIKLTNEFQQRHATANTSCTLARLSGDEFSFTLSDVKDKVVLAQLAQQICDIFAQGFSVRGISHNVFASVGIALFPKDAVDEKNLMLHADAAMYQTKSEGKNSYRFFSHAIAQKTQQRQHIENSLLNSLKTDGFELVYMPIFDAKTLNIEGFEVLLRCPILTQEGIGPHEFIPVAETTGLIQQVDLWVIENAFKTLKELQASHGFNGIVAINISAVELHNRAFPSQVEALIKKYAVDPIHIEFEITETSLTEIDNTSLVLFQQIKALGVRIALDDFGVGYTAFNELASYPVDTLKIDRSFVNKLSALQPNDKSILEIMLALAALYQLKVIAEGVEDNQQLTYLKNCGCNQVQGFYLSKPLSLSAFKKRLSDS